jgi:hypothetical protein
MSYQGIEAAVLAYVRGYADGLVFTEDNARRNDWRVLDAKGGPLSCHVGMGGDSRYGPDVPSEFAGEVGAHGEETALHQVAITLAYKRGTGKGGDALPVDELLEETDALLDYLRADRSLGSSQVIDSQVTRVTRPVEFRPQKLEIGTHVAQRLTLQILESIDL